MTDLSAVAGTSLLSALRLGAAYDFRLRSLRELMDAYDAEIVRPNERIDRRLWHHRRATRAVSKIRSARSRC